MGAAEPIDTTIPESANALAQDASNVLAQAQQAKVSTPQEYELAALELKRIADLERKVEAERKKMKEPVLAAGKAIDAFFSKPLEALADAKSMHKRAILTYQQDQERIRREEEARVQKAQKEEQERLAREAEEAEKAGDTVTANAIIEQAAAMPAAIVPSAPLPSVRGVTKRVTWGAELVSLKELCRAVADGRVPEVAVQANMTFLRQQAVSLKEAFSIPGAKAVATESIAA